MHPELPPPPPPSPYQPPNGDENYHAPGPDLTAVRKRVNLAAILLIVVAVLGMLVLLWPGQSKDKMRETFVQLESMGFQMGDIDVDSLVDFLAAYTLYSKIFQFLLLGFIIYSCLKMRRLESWGMSITAAILSVVPCTHACCWLGLPVGIYALVVLYNPEVKAAFRSQVA